LGIPDAAARARILAVLCDKLRLDGAINMKLLATRTPGCVD
jgi:ATP-dependent 26S proteasome regulatory subunit